MTFVLHIPNASVIGDAFVRRGAAPDGPGAWLILPVLAKRRLANGMYAFAVPDSVETFTSPCAARAWIRARKMWQKSLGAKSAAVRVLRVDWARPPADI
jgi:hypothetical protein